MNGLEGRTVRRIRRPCALYFCALGRLALSTHSDLHLCSPLPSRTSIRRTGRAAKGWPARATGVQAANLSVQYRPYWLSSQLLIAKSSDIERLNLVAGFSEVALHAPSGLLVRLCLPCRLCRPAALSSKGHACYGRTEGLSTRVHPSNSDRSVSSPSSLRSFSCLRFHSSVQSRLRASWPSSFAMRLANSSVAPTLMI